MCRYEQIVGGVFVTEEALDGGARARDPLAAARDHWAICVASALVGLVVGVILGSMGPTQTTAEARLAVGSQSLRAYQVAGFAVASQAMAANYARFVQGSPETASFITSDLG